MTEPLAKDIHRQLLKTFKRNGKHGYCWMLSKFGSSRLDRMSEDAGQKILACLQAKASLSPCPVHQRIHDLV